MTKISPCVVHFKSNIKASAHLAEGLATGTRY